MDITAKLNHYKMGYNDADLMAIAKYGTSLNQKYKKRSEFAAHIINQDDLDLSEQRSKLNSKLTLEDVDDILAVSDLLHHSPKLLENIPDSEYSFNNLTPTSSNKLKLAI